jgi:hypothetical protein
MTDQASIKTAFRPGSIGIQMSILHCPDPNLGDEWIYGVIAEVSHLYMLSAAS